MFATLAQAISSTNPTAASSTSRVGRTSFTSDSWSGVRPTPHPLLVAGYSPPKPGRDRREARGRAVERAARREPPDHEVGVQAAVLQDVGNVLRDRHPQIDLLRVAEPPRRDPDDGDRPAIDHEGPSDDVAGAAEAALPQPVADDRHRIGSGLVLAFGEVPPGFGLDAEHPEEPRGDQRAGVAGRLTVAADSERQGAEQRQ